MKYRLNLHNNHCARQWVTMGSVGGTILDENQFKFPVEMFTKALIESENSSLILYVNVSLLLSKEDLDAASNSKLKHYFHDTYLKSVPQKFKGSDPQDQRPAVTSAQMFEPLCAILSRHWEEKDFKVTQTSNDPLAEVSVTLEGCPDSFSILELIGYPKEESKA